MLHQQVFRPGGGKAVSEMRPSLNLLKSAVAAEFIRQRRQQLTTRMSWRDNSGPRNHLQFSVQCLLEWSTYEDGPGSSGMSCGTSPFNGRANDSSGCFESGHLPV